MPTATLTSKGQLTLPKKVRERLGIHKGDRVEFVIEDSGSVQLRPLHRSIRELAGCLAFSDLEPTGPRGMDADLSAVVAAEDERIRSSR